MRALGISVVAGLLLPASLLAAGEPRSELSRANQQRVQAVLVQRGDLLSVYRADRARRAAIPMPRCRSFHPDRSDLTITGDAASYFTNGNDGIASFASLFASTGDQQSWWRRVVGRPYLRCLARSLAARHQPGVRTKVLQAAMRPTKRYADTATLYRIAIRYTRGSSSIVVYRDIALIGWGRWSAVVVSYAIGQPCPCADDLVRLMWTRMTSAR